MGYSKGRKLLEFYVQSKVIERNLRDVEARLNKIKELAAELERAYPERRACALCYDRDTGRFYMRAIHESL